MKRGCHPLRNFTLPSSLYTVFKAYISPVYLVFLDFYVNIFDKHTSIGFVIKVATKLASIKPVSRVV